mgnify:CR=1 FL=1
MRLPKVSFAAMDAVHFLVYVEHMAWDYTETEYQKQANADPLWRLERLITYGLGKEKLDREELVQYLPKLKIPEDRRAFLELLVWDKLF